MAMYESDHTKFMREWMEKHPEQRAEQKKGRALWWDKPQRVERPEAPGRRACASEGVLLRRQSLTLIYRVSLQGADCSRGGCA